MITKAMEICARRFCDRVASHGEVWVFRSPSGYRMITDLWRAETQADEFPNTLVGVYGKSKADLDVIHSYILEDLEYMYLVESVRGEKHRISGG